MLIRQTGMHRMAQAILIMIIKFLPRKMGTSIAPYYSRIPTIERRWLKDRVGVASRSPANGISREGFHQHSYRKRHLMGMGI